MSLFKRGRTKPRKGETIRIAVPRKTSVEWEKEDESGIVVLDPDGWDRTNYQYSYYEELITLEEYNKRKTWSTCMFNKKK